MFDHAEQAELNRAPRALLPKLVGPLGRWQFVMELIQRLQRIERVGWIVFAEIIFQRDHRMSINGRTNIFARRHR